MCKRSHKHNPLPICERNNWMPSYFNKKSTQIREIRKFDCDNSKRGDSSHEESTKKYPQFAKSDYTFLFLWFRPLHGHWYEGPLMNGSEGGKDSAYSLYSHLEVATEIIYYEFASNLGEYCMNRKAGYFKNTYFLPSLS